MKEFRFTIIVILAAIGLSLYLLYPTYETYQNNKKINQELDKSKAEILQATPNITKENLDKKLRFIEDSIKAANPKYTTIKQKSLKLGLDLQGGMRVVLEVNTGKLLEKLAKSPDDVFKQAITQAEKEAAKSDESVVDIFARIMQQKGIRLSRYFGSIRDDDSKIVSDLKKDADDAVTRAMEIIRNRVDQYGVSEPSIQRQGGRRVIVELPGVAREEEAKQLLQGTALLEFKLVKDRNYTISIMQKIDNVLAGKGPSGDTTSTDSTSLKNKSKSSKKGTIDSALSSNDTTKKQLSKEEFEKEHPFFSIAMLEPNSKLADAYVRQDEKDKLKLMLARPDVQAVMPNNVEFDFSATPVSYQDGKGIYRLYCVNKQPELTGGVITNAQANIDPETSSPVVNMQMNSEGSTEWARITGANVGKRMAIILDGAVYSAPNIIGKIPGGNSQITGMADMEEAKLLEIVLKAGALPLSKLLKKDLSDHHSVRTQFMPDSNPQ